MAIGLHAITFDCDNPTALAEFWARALQCDVDPHEIDGFATIGRHDQTRPFLVFQRIDGERTGTNRVHPDFASKDFDAESQRLIALGATRVQDVAENGIRFTTFADPEGNKFDLSDE
ncbi:MULTISPECIES: VOC family protein [unclassified Mycolicibacterium]|uniref:VOC family protein n=1 Tax=unclassified Mycolicibacterium TaxID=2636767 RepID=UPI002EDB8EC0|nr:VOC family protein [Mycobacterium sp.]